ncbi:hypothetical protein H6F78_12580 [Coleofasciculus sp. FACHB-64]|uniref:hypothetical protein n=1 Tax=Cyanophyceae TaxID=3028117 RepID=UPI00168678AD|nr:MULTISPECIES: hypothetical protein [unclassified Coleofasciculus]MBD1882009.1 hypothetical protein [Coleofasciculus sp. FACHB-T130]MBD1894319.1 hypothetical protein [Coleofasciculus sp. FACHB-129]MBD1901647.1 hypothetical protein [Coleofasciculus sp. FACHB-125]MBD2046416.1 hypothetical protein [Coleofasciculus sp. FACHB-64]MBD2084744.1 hypothetical protein [Coleofasciculus sp. FACHB-542]
MTSEKTRSLSYSSQSKIQNRIGSISIVKICTEPPLSPINGGKYDLSLPVNGVGWGGVPDAK